MSIRMTDVEVVRALDGLTVTARLEPDATGRMVIRELHITGERIEAPAVRRIKLGAIEAEANLPTPDLSDLDAFDGRRAGEAPPQFSERFARAYVAACSVTGKPAVVIAERIGVPVPTVRAWTREARLRGLLPPGRKGRAG